MMKPMVVNSQLSYRNDETNGFIPAAFLSMYL